MEANNNRAININSLNGNSFPVTIEFAKTNNIYRIYLTPISVLEMINLLSLNIFLVFNVDANEYDEGLRSFTLKQLADKYAAYLKAFDEETLLMNKEELVQLLDEISHYNLCLIDAGIDTNLDKAIHIIDLADKWYEKTIINELSANVFLSSHDDCYLHLETNNRNLAVELIALQIKILVATISDCSFDSLELNINDVILEDEFSIVIPQNHIKTSERITWKIFEGTFKDFVYSKEMKESKFELSFYESNRDIKIEKVRSDKTTD